MLGDNENSSRKTWTLANPEKFRLGITEVDAGCVSVFRNFRWKSNKSVGDVKIFFGFRFVTNLEIWAEGIVFRGCHIISK